VSADWDRVKGPLASFVRSLFPRLVYLGKWPSVVVQQSADGLLELRPDDESMPPLVGVPIRLGIPGASVKVASGSRVLLGFEQGDPRKPVAELWDASTATELRLNGATIILNGGSASVARVGDSVSATPSMGVWIAGVSSVLHLAPPSDFGAVSSGAPGVKA